MVAEGAQRGTSPAREPRRSLCALPRSRPAASFPVSVRKIAFRVVLRIIGSKENLPAVRRSPTSHGTACPSALLARLSMRSSSSPAARWRRPRPRCRGHRDRSRRTRALARARLRAPAGRRRCRSACRHAGAAHHQPAWQRADRHHGVVRGIPDRDGVSGGVVARSARRQPSRKAATRAARSWRAWWRGTTSATACGRC